MSEPIERVRAEAAEQKALMVAEMLVQERGRRTAAERDRDQYAGMAVVVQLRLTRLREAASRLVAAWPNDDVEFDRAMRDIEALVVSREHRGTVEFVERDLRQPTFQGQRVALEALDDAVSREDQRG